MKFGCVVSRRKNNGEISANLCFFGMSISVKVIPTGTKPDEAYGFVAASWTNAYRLSKDEISALTKEVATALKYYWRDR